MQLFEKHNTFIKVLLRKKASKSAQKIDCKTMENTSNGFKNRLYFSENESDVLM